MTTRSALPAPLVALLDGTDLAAKIGHTILLTAADESGWPHTALLSVGEVVATSATCLRLATYASSRPTRALVHSGRGLLLTVLEGVTHKVWVEVEQARQATSARKLMVFDAAVVTAEEDEVAYARVRHGIEFDLVDPESVLARWEQQIALLRGGTDR